MPSINSAPPVEVFLPLSVPSPGRGGGLVIYRGTVKTRQETMDNCGTTSAQAPASGAADAQALMNRNRAAGVMSTTGYTAKAFTSKREVTFASWNVRTSYQVGQKEIT